MSPLVSFGRLGASRHTPAPTKFSRQPSARSAAIRGDPRRSSAIRSDPAASEPLFGVRWGYAQEPECAQTPVPCIRTDPNRSEPIRTDPNRSEPIPTDPNRPQPTPTDLMCPFLPPPPFWCGRDSIALGAASFLET